MKESGGVICHWVGKPRDVVMVWYVAMEPLMNSKKAKEVSRLAVCCGTVIALSKEGWKVVSFAEDGAFSNIIVLANDF